MNKPNRLLIVSILGWLVFLNVGWLHRLPLFNLMPTPPDIIITIARWITRLGDPTTLIYATILVVFYLGYSKRCWLLAVTMAFTMLIGWWLMDLFKSWWSIPRPLGAHLVNVSDFSYPSGHAMLSLVFYGFLAWYLAQEGISKVWSIMLILIAILIGISRPLLNVHFPADVIGGWGAGIGWLTLVLWLYYQLLHKRKEMKAEQ
ncbi:MAG: phosphatase PAP2 family protein [Methylocystaceae bacterium]